MKFKVILFLSLLLLFQSTSAQNEEEEDEDEDEEDIPGHMQPLGSSSELIPVEVRDDLPDPVEFFDKYVKPSRPVLFRGAAKKIPSFNNFRNDTYLKENYGDWKVQAEKGKKENRKQAQLKMSFRKFISKYHKKEIYLVSDLHKGSPLIAETYIPRPLLCDDFLKRFDACVMWFSSGGTKSVLHTDASENINCLFDGSKELIMGHKKHGSLFGVENTGSFSKVDVDSVDMHKYPDLARVPWHIAKMEAGDCFYIPIKWAHYVKSSSSRNLAVNLWWHEMLDFPNREECKEQIKKEKDFEPFATRYKVEPEEKKRSRFLSTFEGEVEPITPDRFYDGVFSYMTVKRNETDNIFAQIDQDSDGLIWFKNLYNVNLEVLKPMLDLMDVIEKQEEADEEEGQKRQRDEL